METVPDPHGNRKTLSPAEVQMLEAAFQIRPPLFLCNVFREFATLLDSGKCFLLSKWMKSFLTKNLDDKELKVFRFLF